MQGGGAEDETMRNNHQDHHSEEEEDEDECRVCRGPAEDGRPLYKPCVCSGSIGLTHQDCLQSWLQVQRGSSRNNGKCELCHTKFQFAPKYAINAPTHLPPIAVFVGIWKRIISKYVPLFLRILFAISLWLFVAPLITSYLYHGWMARPSVIFERMWNWKNLITDLVSGDVIAACIIVSFLSLMSFADFLRVEWQQRGLAGVGVVNGVNNGNGRFHNNNDLANNNNNNNNHHNYNAPIPEEDIDNGIWEHIQQQVIVQQQTTTSGDDRTSAAAAAGADHPPFPQREISAAMKAGTGSVGSDDDNDDSDNDDHDSSSYPGSENDDDGEGSNNWEQIGDSSDDDDHGGDDDDEEEEEEEEDWDDEEEEDDDDDDTTSSEEEEEEEDNVDYHGRGAGAGAGPDPVVVDGIMPPLDDRDDDNGREMPVVDPQIADEIERILLRQRQDDVQQQPHQPPLPPHLPRDDDDDDEARIDAPPPPPPVDMDQDEPVDVDINIALDELLGVRGPLLVVGRNLLWLLAFNAVYLGFFAFVPRTVGMAIGSILFNTTIFSDSSSASSNSNITDEVLSFNTTETVSFAEIWKAIDAESVRQNTAFRLHDIATVALGYFSLAFLVVLFRFLWFVSQKVRDFRSGNRRADRNNDFGEVRDAFEEMNRIVHNLGNDAPQFGEDGHGFAVQVALGVALDAMMAIVKVGVLLFLKMFLLPIVLGIALDASTTTLLGSTLEGRISYAGKDIFSFILLHWVAGITFMLLVTVSVLQLREVAHPELLAQMIRPQEPQPDLLGNLMHESIGTHSKRMFLSLIIYAFLLTLHVYVPLNFGITKLIGKTLKPHLELKFAYILTPQLQVPLELLFFHLCMLALLEKYKNGLGGMQHNWLKFMTSLMGLSDHIMPRRVAKFRLIGSRALFQYGSSKIDSFWYDMANSDKNALALLESNVSYFAPRHTFSDGETKTNGERVLRGGCDYIRLPVRLPGRALRSRSLLLPTKVGKYRLKRDPFLNSNPHIQLWVEVPGDPIPRPPEGWDDLGAGGADVQGRWAWGNENQSAIERGVAARQKFFEKNQKTKKSISICLKLLLLAILSWVASTTLFCIVAATPLVVGRCLFCVLRVPDKWIHDPLGFGLGFLLVFPIVRKGAHLLMSSDQPLYRRLFTWIGNFHAPTPHKSLVLVNAAIFWFGVAPLLLGSIYDIAFVKTTEWFEQTEPLIDRRTITLEWLVGTLLLWVWSDLCILGVFTRDYRAVLFEGRDVAENGADPDQPMAWQGVGGHISRFWATWRLVISNWEWDIVDENVLLHQCASPVVIELATVLAIPLAALFLCCSRFHMLSGFTRAVLVRSILALTSSVQLGRLWKEQLRNWFNAAHKAVHDDRYLIGEILLNHGESI